MDQYRFPQYLSNPLQVLWFEADEVVVIALFFTISSVIGGVSWLLFLLGPYCYYLAKQKYPNGFIHHLLYFTGIKEMARYPGFFENFFNE